MTRFQKGRRWANFWTTLRAVLAVPVFGLLLTGSQQDAALLFIFGYLITGWLDGAVARFYKCGTDKGAQYDAIASCILGCAAHLGLIINGTLPWWTFLLRAFPLALAKYNTEKHELDTRIYAQIVMFVFGGVIIEGGIGYTLFGHYLSPLWQAIVVVFVICLAMARRVCLLTFNVNPKELRQLHGVRHEYPKLFDYLCRGIWLYKRQGVL